MNNLSIREKIYQMFILGLEGEALCSNPEFACALENNLGGVIFFTQNIDSVSGFKKLVSDINNMAKTPLFLSIDQEGGRVERTLNLHNGPKYLCARECAKRGVDFCVSQTQEIAAELRNLGLNMNFAPVLDVDTNPQNPVIAERSYSSNPDDVSKFGKIVAETYIENGIIPVGKHFPGHGDTAVDSHKNMPEVNLTMEELENVHLKPFKSRIDTGLPAVMAAHVHYFAFDEEKIPASVSKNVLEGYLRGTLGFKGLIISDDMVMGGIKGFSSLEACMRGIDAGINMFIFRNSDSATISMIEALVQKTIDGEIDEKKIDFSLKKILELKKGVKRWN